MKRLDYRAEQFLMGNVKKKKKLMRVFSLTCVVCALLISLGCMSAQERRIEQNRELFDSLNPEIQSKVLLGQIDIGYTRDMVRLVLGHPNRIYTRKTSEGFTTLWLYVRTKTHHGPKWVDIPVRTIDSKGKKHTEYQGVWIDFDSKYEYPIAKVEFDKGVVKTFEQLQH